MHVTRRPFNGRFTMVLLSPLFSWIAAEVIYDTVYLVGLRSGFALYMVVGMSCWYIMESRKAYTPHTSGCSPTLSEDKHFNSMFAFVVMVQIVLGMRFLHF